MAHQARKADALPTGARILRSISGGSLSQEEFLLEVRRQVPALLTIWRDPEALLVDLFDLASRELRRHLPAGGAGLGRFHQLQEHVGVVLRQLRDDRFRPRILFTMESASVALSHRRLRMSALDPVVDSAIAVASGRPDRFQTLAVRGAARTLLDRVARCHLDSISKGLVERVARALRKVAEEAVRPPPEA